MSSFDTDKKGGKEISQLETYSGDSSILDALITANDTIPDVLTFDIGRTNGENGYGKYNGNKIHLTDDSGSDPHLSNGFKKYKHTPVGNGDSNYGCVIYNRDVLMGRDGNAIGQIQNQQYLAVNVYFGEKEKRTNGGALSVPLLIELNKNGTDPDYYVHKKNPSDGTNGVKYYWEQMPGSQGEELKSLLKDIGLSTSEGGRGYETLKSLLGQASLKNGDENDLSSKLKKATGSTLKSLLGQKVNGSKSLLVVLLERVEFNLVDSVVILVGRKNDSGSYGDSEIGDAVENLDPKRDVNRIKLSDGDEIVLKDKTNENGKCVKDLNYKVMEHDFSKYVKELKPPEQEWAGLRFLIPAANNGDKYKELSLYGPTGPENLVYKYYSVSNGSKVYVVFYGSDKRPLMICYGGDAFVPRDKGNYDSEWVKASGIKNCECTGDGQKEALLKALIRVVGFLNEVNLSKHPPTTTNGTCNSGVSSEGGTVTTCPTEKNGASCTYEVHKYNTKKVQIKVECKSVNGEKLPNGKSCYRKLTHVPIGINGTTNGSGFRLGNVVYNGNSISGSIEYYPKGPAANGGENWCKPLVKVEAYFYNEDKNYEDPLLVVLEFKKNGEGKGKECEYYMLTKTANGTGGKMEWTIDTSAIEEIGSEDNSNMSKYLDGIRYGLKQVLKVEIDKTSSYQAMGRDGNKPGTASNGFEPLPGANGNNVQVQAYTSGMCAQLKSSNYKCYRHQLTSLGDKLNKIGGLAFTIPGEKGEEKVIQLYNGTAEGPATDCSKNQNGQQITPLFYNSCMGDIYVYFYGEDPRPLLLCFNKKAYRAQTKECYFKEWVQDSTIEKCDCSDGNGNVTKMFESLTEVVGFLNEVDLSKHPTGTNGKGCNAGSSDAGTANTCNTPAPEKNGTNFCTYVVHEYEGKKVMVKVTCEAVPATPSGNKCYRKLTHQHAGINGQGNGNKFRLGNVVYNKGGASQGSIDYYPYGLVNGDDHPNKFKPLIRVGAYFYDADKEYQDPLLVVLEFKNNGVGAETDKEYYKLKRRDTGGMEWEKDEEACKLVKENGEGLVKYLDCIRYGLKKVLQIMLEKNEAKPYTAMGRASSDTSGAGNVFQALNDGSDKKIEVEVCEEGECSELKNANYKCYQHKITEALKDIHDQVAGLAFTIPGTPLNSVIEIPLFNVSTTEEATPDCKNVKTRKIEQLTYNKCMGDIYVFFYGTGGGSDGNEVDTVPLMLWYAGNYYKPCNRDDYFTKWVTVPGLSGQGPPCEGVGGEKLAEELDIVNRALNIIELDHQKVGAGTGQSGSYGLPEEVVGDVKPDPKLFPAERVTLTKQQGPSKPPGSHAYYRVVHRTVNGFQIGEIMYGGNEIVASGVIINGSPDATIKVKQDGGGSDGNKNHKNLVTQNKWNTVVAYYSSSDGQFQLPQLIVILKTDKEVSSEPVTTSADYGYYILTNKNGGKEYEYKWFKVENKQVTLDDPTDFRLLNSVVILLDKRGGTSYNDSEISNAISKAGLRSPGQTGEINRITGKTITVRDATTESTCLSKTGFKVFTHDISQLVKLNGSLKGLTGVKLIAGLRFLIPTLLENDYEELQLNAEGKKVILYHHNSQNKVYVFFYGSDPRPLMLCYDGNAYRAKNMDDYYCQNWTKDGTVNKCVCTSDNGDKEKLLKALVNVSDFLNLVKLDRIRRNYIIHRFNGKWIKIRVESKKANETFCYNKYIHTPEMSGFRLGTIEYNGTCILKIDENGTNNGRGASNGTCITSALSNGDDSNKYKSAEKVVVFYYQGDKELERPLLVALCKNGDSNECTVYYELQKGDEKSSGVKKYTQVKGTINVNDTKPTGTLSQTLDRILFQISKKLQIIIDKRPVVQLYTPNDKMLNCDKSDAYKTQDEALKCRREMDYRIMTCKMEENAEKTEKPEIYVYDKETGTYFIIKDEKGNYCVFDDRTEKPITYHLPTKTCYQAQLYNTTADTPVKNGPTTKNVKVTPVDCWQLTTYGYKCYEHQITDVTGVEEIGGLKFYLWDNTSDSSSTNCGSSPGSPGCPTANNAATCRELCLYKVGGDSTGEKTILRKVDLISVH